MSRKKDTADTFFDFIFNLIVALMPLYIIFLFAFLFLNKQAFWKLLLIGLGVIVSIFFIWLLINRAIKDKKEKLIEDANRLGLNNDINNFINRSGKEKGKGVWQHMGYGFNLDRMRIFIKTLAEKGLKIKEIDDLEYVLTRFIDNKEEALLKGGFESKQYKFSSLSGTDFENLLVRLYELMGYIVQHPGGRGDQGGDLILNKEGQRILVQAKRRTDNIGNRAVQEAVAAKKYYDCNRVMLIGSSNFTREALELASANEVELIGKKELQGLLLSHLKENWD